MPEETEAFPEPEVIKKTSPVKHDPYHPTSDVGSGEIGEISLRMKELQKSMKRVERRLFWILMGSYLKLLIIIVPIILGFLFLPSLFSQYAPLLDSLGDSASVLTNLQESLELLK